MKSMKFTVSYNGVADAPATLSETLTPMGSLRASRQAWARLVMALGGTCPPYLQGEIPLPAIDAAASIVREAVPDEGDPHPIRATCTAVGATGEYDEDSGRTLDYTGVGFRTPGGVWVAITLDHISGELWVTIEFGRDSRFLATQIAAELFHHDPRQARRILHFATRPIWEVQVSLAYPPGHTGRARIMDSDEGCGLDVIIQTHDLALAEREAQAAIRCEDDAEILAAVRHWRERVEEGGLPALDEGDEEE